MNRTKKLMQRISKLEDEAEHQATIDYPIGCRVSWTHGNHDRMGEVIRHGE